MNWLPFYFSRLQQLKGCLLFTEQVWAALGTPGAGLVSRWARNWDTSDSTLPIQRHPHSPVAWGKAGEEPFLLTQLWTSQQRRNLQALVLGA